MRPLVGGDALPALSRKQSFADPEVTTPVTLPTRGGPTTFFMSSESMMEASTTAAGPAAGSESNFGVRSLDSTTDAKEIEQGDEEHSSTYNIPNSRRRSTLKANFQRRRDQPIANPGHASAPSSPDTSPGPHHQHWQYPDDHPHLATHSSLVSLALGSSVPSSPKSTSTRSLRLSDEDSCGDGASQAVVSSGDEDNDHDHDTHGTLPQLIMPSIMMPSRRPFTECGKTIDRLKVLIAGPSGVGKSSLIKSIVQVCEDIVHVDPLSSNSPSLESLSTRRSKPSSNALPSGATNQIVEVYASTKAYPSWWSDLEDSHVLRRRKSGGDTVLERNICFVDTPGYDPETSVLESVNSVLHYIEAQMAKNISFSHMSDIDLLSMLGGAGGFQVDVVLYLFAKDLQPTDIEFLSRLSQTTNVIPLLAKADTLSEDEIKELKASVPKQLEAAGIRPFVFGTEHAADSPPFAVCSSASNDEDNMDASLLMSPDYIQPLLPSELLLLVKQIFNKDNVSWLRHSAAKKIIEWRKTPRAMSIIRPTSRISSPTRYDRANTSPLTISTASITSPSQAIISYPSSPLSYTHARIADHTQREERLARVQLANWAGNLQRSLQNERGRYEALLFEQRAAWLKERLGECKIDGSPVTSSQETALVAGFGNDSYWSKETSARTSAYRGTMHPADPLGLLRWNEIMKSRGWFALQAGSFGALALVAIWAVRNWGLSMGYDGSMSWSWNWFGGAE
ncbi:hypothetical protein MMC26_005993 [Xylographa opegraphella]|nr:hypothetical protein [Xylographa opegraphella]